MKKIILMVGMVLFLLSCGGNASDKVVFETKTTDGKTIKVYESEINYEIENYGVDLFNELTPEEQERTKKEIIQSIAFRRAVAQEAKNKNVDKEDYYKKELEISKETLLGETYIKNLIDEKTVVTDDEIKAFYDENIDKYTNDKNSARVQMIILNATNQKEYEANQKKAKEIMGEINANNFEEVLLKNTKDQNAKNSKGIIELDLDALGPGTGELKEAINTTKPGEMHSKTVVINGQIYIVKVLDKKKKGDKRSFENAKTEIKAYLKNTKTNEEVLKFKEEIEKKYNLTPINQDGAQTETAPESAEKKSDEKTKEKTEKPTTTDKKSTEK